MATGGPTHRQMKALQRPARRKDLAGNEEPVRYRVQRGAVLDNELAVFTEECEVIPFLAMAAPKQLHGERGALSLEIAPRQAEDVKRG